MITEKIVLQYGPVGANISETMLVHVSEAGQFVALDSASGGYPYAASALRAHDFKTVEAAQNYRGHFPGLLVKKLRITYEVQDI